MEQELDCIFYFGDATAAKVKKMDYRLFNTTPTELHYVKLFHQFNWLKGALPLIFKPYSKYILTGEPFCLSTWFILLFARLNGKHVYLWSHGWYGDEGKAKTLVKKIFFKLAKGVLLYGNYAKELMIKSGIRAGKLHVVYNSLAYSQQIAIRRDLTFTDVFKERFRNVEPTLIFIGRVQPKKKLALLITMLSRAKAQRRFMNLVVVGDGSDLDAMRNLSIQLELSDTIWFVGSSYDEAMNASFIYNADLCVSPGEVGLTGIHALSFGTPVITHNNFRNQMPEFEAIHVGETGDFFQEGDIDDLLTKVVTWLEKHPRKTEALIERCYAVVDKYYNPEYQIKTLSHVLSTSK